MCRAQGRSRINVFNFLDGSKIVLGESARSEVLPCGELGEIFEWGIGNGAWANDGDISTKGIYLVAHDLASTTAEGQNCCNARNTNGDPKHR